MRRLDCGFLGPAPFPRACARAWYICEQYRTRRKVCCNQSHLCMTAAPKQEPGVFWIQTTDPQFSRKLETRHNMRRVEVVGVNHFRRTFETRGTWRKVQRIIDRFLVSAGGHFFYALRPQNRSKRAGSVMVPPSSNRQIAPFYLQEVANDKTKDCLPHLAWA